MAEKDSLVKISQAQQDPYYVTGNDFPAVGSSKDGSSGKDKLVDQSDLQCSPRNAEGSGGDPDSMSAKASAVGSNFKVSVNSIGSKSVSIPESLDITSGDISVKGANVSPKHEVPDKFVKLA
jgi:hypothetical protein